MSSELTTSSHQLLPYLFLVEQGKKTGAFVPPPNWYFVCALYVAKFETYRCPNPLPAFSPFLVPPSNNPPTSSPSPIATMQQPTCRLATQQQNPAGHHL